MEQTLKHKTALGLFWGGMSNGILQFLSMLFGVLLARLLNASDYGLIGMLAIFSGIAGNIVNSGFTVALTNKKNINHRDYNAVFWFTFFVGAACYILLFLLAPFIAKFYGHPELTKLSRVIFLSFFFAGCASVSYTVLFKNLMVKQQAFIDIFSIILSGIVGVTLAINGFSYWALALRNVVFVISGALIRFIVAPWKPTFEIDFKPLKDMFSFSVNILFTNIFAQINGNFISVFLGKFYSANQLGFYTQGQKWVGMGQSLIMGMINNVSQPILVSVLDDEERIKKILRKLLKFGAFVSFPSFLGLAFVSKEFIIITIGEKWLSSVIFMQIFCIWGMVSFIWTIYSNLLMSYGKSDKFLKGNLLVGLLQLLFILVFFRISIVWMVVAYVFAYYLGLVYWHYSICKLVDLKMRDILSDILPYMCIVLILLFVVWIITCKINNVYFLFISKVLSFIFLYLVVMWKSKSIIFRESVMFVKRKMQN